MNTKHFEDKYKEQNQNSALTVNQGVDTPPCVNPNYTRPKRREMSVEQYVDGILRGDIVILSQAITLVESALQNHKQTAQQIIEKCIPHSGKAQRIGITGVPGAGKSTFIEAIGEHITKQNRKIAVLAIDPSSQRSKGSILGDKTRMETLAHNPKVFIRPSPSGNSLGGVARKTRETMILCEAAGFDTIFIETVGVGQSETAVHSMVDIFLMLQISGAGDELQGIKRGIMEMADIIAITKADGQNIPKAEITKSQIENALWLFPMPKSGIKPTVHLISATENKGLQELWDKIQNYLQTSQNFTQNRKIQNTYWITETINETILSDFYNNPTIAQKLETAKQKVMDQELSPFQAAQTVLKDY